MASSGVGARGVNIRELRRHPGMSLRHPSSSSGVGALVVDHGLREPSKGWSHHVHTESATRVRGNPGKETKGEGGWVLWPAAHLSPRGVLRLLLFSLAVSLFCGVATGTSETSLLSPADFEADAARHSHLPVASGTPGARHLKMWRQCHCVQPPRRIGCVAVENTISATTQVTTVPRPRTSCNSPQ